MSRLLSVNEIEAEFKAEDLEERMEMQLLGLAFDTSAFFRSDGTVSRIVRYYSRGGKLRAIK